MGIKYPFVSPGTAGDIVEPVTATSFVSEHGARRRSNRANRCLFEARHKVTAVCGTTLLRFAICKHQKVDQMFLTPFFLFVELANIRQQVCPR